MPPSATSNSPTRCSSAPVKLPLRWPNNSLSIRLSGNAPQLMATNGISAAVALVVDRPGDQFLAGAGFAGDEHRRIGRRDFGDQLLDAVDVGRLADKLRWTFDRLQPPLQGPVFVRQFPLLNDAIQQCFDFHELARLGEIIERPVPQGGHGRFQRRFAGEHDRFGVGRKFLALGDDLHAVEAWHIEIDDDAIVGVALERGDGRQTIGADRGFMPHAIEFDAHQFLQRTLVVGKEQLQSFARLGSDG